MAMELLVVGGPSDSWIDAVVAAGKRAMTVAVVEPGQLIDTSSVRVLVGAPPDLAPLITDCPQLQWVQSTWAGVDALMGSVPQNVQVTPLKGVFGQAMSEFVLGWLLALERNIITRANTKHWIPEVEAGVSGKRLGIMGTGTIGSVVATHAAQFGLEVIGLNSGGQSVPGFVTCYSSDNRLEFADGLDYLVCLLPGTPETDGIIDTALLTCMNSGAILINAGRGNAVVDVDLIKALRDETLRYAVLDVFTEEPLPDSHELWQVPGLFITSHTAAPTPAQAIPEVFARNLELFLLGEPMVDAMCSERGY